MKTLTIKTLLLASMLFSGATLAAQAADAKILRLSNPPQASGIQIGDVLQRTVAVELAQPYQISKSTLPAKGTRTDGIELVDVAVNSAEHDNKTVYEISLSYQVFAAASNPKVMQLPKQSFAVTGGQKALSVSIPAWGFWFSPLVGATDIASAKANLQPSQPPLLVDASLHQVKLMVFAGLFLIGLIAIIYINADRRWLPFMGGPFAEAHRKIKRLPLHSAQEKQALFHLHQAFNQTFGANLFEKNLHQFMAEHPKFSRLTADIQAFFEISNRALFAGHADEQTSVKDLLALSKNLRNSERGV